MMRYAFSRYAVLSGCILMSFGMLMAVAASSPSLQEGKWATLLIIAAVTFLIGLILFAVGYTTWLTPYEREEYIARRAERHARGLKQRRRLRIPGTRR